MGWMSLHVQVKLPEHGVRHTVTYRVSEDGDADLVGYDVDAHLESSIREEMGNLRRVAAADLRAEGKPEEAEYIEEIADRLEAALRESEGEAG